MFLLGTLLAPSQLVLVFSHHQGAQGFFSHVAVVLVVNNPMQRDEHTKGQCTNAMHMHVHAFSCGFPLGFAIAFFTLVYFMADLAMISEFKQHNYLSKKELH